MAVRALNFNGFVEKNSLFSYRELFASESTLLKGKPLCQYLTEMDQQEYEIVKLENAEFNALPQRITSNLPVTFVALAVIAALGLKYADQISHYFDNILSRDTVQTLSQDAIPGTVLLAAPGGVFSVVAYELHLSQEKVKQIYDNRLLRLQDKIRCLEGRLIVINEPLETEQLIQAKNHFSFKYQRYLAEKLNVLTVK